MSNNSPRYLWLLLAGLLAVSGCATTEKYTSTADGGPARAADYPIFTYSANVEVPRETQTIGTMVDKGGKIEEIMEKLRVKAREKGADAIRVDVDQADGMMSSSYKVTAAFVKFTDTWETLPVTEESFLAYLKANAGKLDPIEGVWKVNDASQTRIGIMRNNANPNRIFVGVVLRTKNLAWQPGQKKLEIMAKDARSVYDLTYYQDDYQSKDAVVQVTTRAVRQFEVITSEATSVDAGSGFIFTRQ